MSLDSCFDREMDILEEALASGQIDTKEYNRAIRELESEAREIAQGNC